MNFKHIFSFLFINVLLAGCMSERKPFPEKSESPLPVSLNWPDTIKKLGTVHMGDTIHFAFRFHNTGSQPVVIEKAESSCSCTEAIAPEKPVKAGGTDSIGVILYTQKTITGSVRKMIRVRIAGSKQPQILLYEAEITGHKKLTRIYI